VGELAQDLEIVPSTVSHHIKELYRAGLIRMQRKGQNVECWIDPEVLKDLKRFFSL
jgi:ArsR family transcriptional regulator